MKRFALSLILLESILLVQSEDDYFLRNLKNQFGDVPRDVKLFDFLQNENNLQGLLGLHNDMCEQLNHFNELKANHRARRDVRTADSTTPMFGVSENVTDNAVVFDSNATTVESNTDSSSTSSSSVQRKRRDVSDSSASTTNTTASSNQTDDKDQQQNLNDQQPPADDQGDQQAPAGGENQEAEMQAAGVAYFKQLILNVLRYILNCLMTYINIFY